jgi:hypothetical protein
MLKLLNFFKEDKGTALKRGQRPFKGAVPSYIPLCVHKNFINFADKMPKWRNW